MTRILGFVSNCATCSHSRGHECTALNNARISRLDTIASFCPLPRYPTEEIENLETTVEGQRHLINKTGPWTVGQFVIMQIAQKLNTYMTPDCSVVLHTRDDKEIVLSHCYYQSTDRDGWSIFLSCDGKVKYRVHVGREFLIGKYTIIEVDGKNTEMTESICLK